MSERSHSQTSRLIRLLPHHLPVVVRRQILNELMAATAAGFEAAAPAPSGRGWEARLLDYARFTRAQAEQALQGGGDLAGLRSQLYLQAYPLGRRLRRLFGVQSTQEVMALGAILYRAIGVEMEGQTDGQITVRRCLYSQFYSGAVCDLISAVDEGVFAGLSGGGRLVFRQRLTEGGAVCRAELICGRG